MRPQTATKLAIAAVIAILFAGFILRAAMHSMFIAVLVLIVIVWVLAKFR